MSEGGTKCSPVSASAVGRNLRKEQWKQFEEGATDATFKKLV
jgi:hypothetical protein